MKGWGGGMMEVQQIKSSIDGMDSGKLIPTPEVSKLMDVGLEKG